MVTPKVTRKIHVTGVVQGVGFRPFVYQIATRGNLQGWVANTSAGVDIELQGDPSALDAFVRALTKDKPPLARIDSVDVRDVPSDGQPPFERFEIRESVPVAGAFQPISPDISICPDCLSELFDPNDRRYLYPFINCTNCGPRFTIIKDIPYDRPLTTMRTFPMCEDCAREYHDPLDRRFHAQPVACPKCGPHVWLEPSTDPHRLPPIKGEKEGVAVADPIIQTRDLLANGAIVAIKGLGGFHLACDATNADAVQRLRERKGRVDKPFALMALDVAAVEQFCYVSDAERALLESRARPIVLLCRRSDSAIADAVAPNNDYLGVMLPYTPLHYILLTGDQGPATAVSLRAERRTNDSARNPQLGDGDCFVAAPPESGGAPAPRNDMGPAAVNGRWSAVLVMTSGNFSEEPIAIDNADARERLSNLADYFLMHDRAIETRADDSVVRVFEERELPIRRSRGYAPYPVHLPFPTQPTLAVGAELKNTFCVTREQYAFVSQHIGDLENYPTLQSFEQQIEHFKRLFRIEPEILAYDLHPNYLSTQYAKGVEPREDSGTFARLGVQHHHAHIASCMAENGLPDESVIGIAFDGTGYGTDGKIWGGEFLIARYGDFRRAAHLAYVPLPGGDAGIKRVYRSALAHLAHAGIAWEGDLACVAAASETERGVIHHQIETGFNAPQTSSIGRLFDAVSAIIGVRETVNYEAQAAIELEHLVVQDITASYDFGLQISDFRLNGEESTIIDPSPVIRAVVKDYREHVPPWVIASRFHNAVAKMAADVAVALREREGVKRVVLSGGVFQNVTLLTRALAQLRGAGFEVYTHHLVPPNDAGISLGQAVIANMQR